MPRARNSDQIKLTRDLRSRLHEQTEPPTVLGCCLYHPVEHESQIRAEIAGKRGLQICSVRRVAWAFAHEHEVGWDDQGRLKGCLGPKEEVVTLCGTVGDENTGDGQCVNPEHLGRGDEGQRIQLHRALRTLHQVKETTR